VFPVRYERNTYILFGADSHSGDEGISIILWNPTVHYHVKKRPSPVSVLSSQLNPDMCVTESIVM
jgi:hypothetical protein